MKYRVFRATGPAAIDETLAPGVAFQIEEIRLHLAAGGAAGDLIVTVDSDASTAAGEYDVVLLTADMTGAADLVWQPTRPLVFAVGDEIDIAYAANVQVFGLEVYYSAI